MPSFVPVLECGKFATGEALRLSENSRGKSSAPIHAVFFMYGLMKTAFLHDPNGFGVKGCRGEIGNTKTEPRGKEVTTSGSSRKIFSTSADEQCDKSPAALVSPDGS